MSAGKGPEQAQLFYLRCNGPHRGCLTDAILLQYLDTLCVASLMSMVQWGHICLISCASLCSSPAVNKQQPAVTLFVISLTLVGAAQFLAGWQLLPSAEVWPVYCQQH